MKLTDEYATDPDEIAAIKQMMKTSEQEHIVALRKRVEAQRKAPKTWYICDICGMGVKGQSEPSICPQCSSGYETISHFRPASQDEAKELERRDKEFSERKFRTIDEYYGESVTSQLRSIYERIDASKKGDPVDVLCARDSFLRHCEERACLADQFENAERIGENKPEYLEWYKSEFAEAYPLWKEGKKVPLSLLQYDFLWKDYVEEEVIKKCENSVE